MNILRVIFNSLTGKPKVRLSPYLSYGSEFHLHLLGRALDDDALKIKERQSFWYTLKNTYKQFDVDEIAGAKVELELPSGTNLQAQTGAQGYLIFDMTLESSLSAYTDSHGWVTMQTRFLEEVKDSTISGDNRFEAQMLIPPNTAKFGVISDIDDTLLHTGVTSFLKWRVLKNSLFKNAYDRIYLEGAPALYQKLHKGRSGVEQNPLFYLSNSPWNLYEYLRLFLSVNNFPKGPILLRHFRTPFDRSTRPEKPHKQREILNLLQSYPDLNFVLIGDSGEHDPAIYTEIAERFPDRILAIYLRSVKHRRKMERVEGLISEFKTVPVVSVKHSDQAIEHARELGLIS